jgi:hypothetical protein
LTSGGWLRVTGAAVASLQHGSPGQHGAAGDGEAVGDGDGALVRSTAATAGASCARDGALGGGAAGDRQNSEQVGARRSHRGSLVRGQRNGRAAYSTSGGPAFLAEARLRREIRRGSRVVHASRTILHTQAAR